MTLKLKITNVCILIKYAHILDNPFFKFITMYQYFKDTLNWILILLILEAE